MFDSASTLLQALLWPPAALSDTGVLTWAREAGTGTQMRLLAASVVVTQDAIACRMRSARVADPARLETHVDLAWDIRGPRPQLIRWVLDGRPKALEEPVEAVQHFRSTVQSLGVSPTFQRHGVRRSAAREEW